MRKLFVLAAVAWMVAVLVVLGLGQGQPALADPADLIVDPDGTASVTAGVPDCNTGTADATTIQGGVTGAAAGDTINVCPGTYSEDVLVNVADLTIIGTDLSDKPEVYGQDTLDCVFVVVSPGVEITGFDISSTAATPQCGIFLINNGSEVSENFVHDNGGLGIAIFSDNNDIHDNTVNENGVAGIAVFSAGAGNTIEDNTSNRNALDGILINGDGNTVEDNTANHNPGRGIVVFFPGAGGDNNDLLGNTVNRNGEFGILLDDTTGDDVIGNTAIGNASGGIRLTPTATGNVLTNNVASRNGQTPTLAAFDDDGIHIDGDGNTLTENKAFANVDDGIEDHGDTTSTCPTTGPTKNKARANGGDDFVNCP